MVDRKISCVFIAMFVLMSVHSSDSIKCWTCSSTVSTKATCGANFDKTGMVSEECGDVSCGKVVVVWEKDPGHGLDKETFNRGCARSKENDGCSKTEGTAEYTGNKYTTETCYCNTDECNTAMLPRVSLLAFGLGLLLKIIF